MMFALLERLSPPQIMTLGLVTIVATAGSAIWIVELITTAWRRTVVSRHDAELKRQMIDRGLSADEIARVIDARRASEATAPCASEAVVQKDGDWTTALILARAEGQYFVHYVGSDMDENEWVDADRVRLPAGAPAVDHGYAGAFAKPEGFGREI